MDTYKYEHCECVTSSFLNNQRKNNFSTIIAQGFQSPLNFGGPVHPPGFTIGGPTSNFSGVQQIKKSIFKLF